MCQRLLFLCVTLFVLVGDIVAQQCGSVGVTKTLSNPSDFSAISACQTFYGNIALSPSLSGNVTLNGIEILKGDLICNDASNLAVFETDDLESVEGEIRFSNCQNLRLLDFSSFLRNATSMKLTNLPLLSDLWDGFAKYGNFQAERTGLVNMSFYLDKDFETSSIIFRDNPSLWSFSLSGYDLEMGKFAITNSPQAKLSISGLDTLSGLELRNIRSLYSPSTILNITGDLILENVAIGYSLDKLKYVGGNLQLFNTSAEHSEYGHANVIDLNALRVVGGKLQIYNVWEHTSAFIRGYTGYSFTQPDIGSVDIAGLIHELPDSIDFGSRGPNTTYINFRSSNGFFDCCRYAYLSKRLDIDFFCAENVTLPPDDDYSKWELGAQRPSSTRDTVDIKSCKSSEDSPKYSKEPTSSSSGGGSSGGGSSVDVNLSPKNKKLIGAIVGPVSAAILGVIFFCCRRHRKAKKKEEAVAAANGEPNMVQQSTVVAQSNKADSYRQDPAWTRPATVASSGKTHGVPAVIAPATHPARTEVASEDSSQLLSQGSCEHCQHCQHGRR